MRRNETKDGFWKDAPERCCNDGCRAFGPMLYHSEAQINAPTEHYSVSGWTCDVCGYFYQEEGTKRNVRKRSERRRRGRQGR